MNLVKIKNNKGINNGIAKAITKPIFDECLSIIIFLSARLYSLGKF